MPFKILRRNMIPWLICCLSEPDRTEFCLPIMLIRSGSAKNLPLHIFFPATTLKSQLPQIPNPDFLNKVTPKEPKWRGWSRETGAQEPRVRHKLLLSRRCKSWDGVCAKFPPTSPSPSCRQTPGGATTPRGGNVLRNFLPVIKKPS